MTKRRWATLLPAFFLAATTYAEVPTDEIVVETIDVDVVSLDIFVTDAAGRPVAGLTGDDFEILENGARREISNFSEVREEVLPALRPTEGGTPTDRIDEQRSRKMIFLVDGETLHPFNRNRVFEEIRGLTGQLLRPGDQAMLAVWNDGLRVEVPFTSLISEFERQLVGLAKMNTGKSARSLRRRQAEDRVRSDLEMALDRDSTYTMKDAYKDSISIGHAYADEKRTELRARVTAINGLLSTLAGVSGKKAMVYIGEELSLRPGIEMFQYVNDTFQPHVTGGGDSVVMSHAESLAPPESLLIESVGRIANANGVTVYMLNPAASQNLTESMAESRGDRSASVGFLDSMSGISAFQSIAAATGGLAFLERSDVRQSFRSIERDFDTYYALGFRAAESSAPGERKLIVRTKRPGLEVRTRRNYYAKTPQDEMVDRVVANLFYETGAGELPIRLTTGKPQKAKRGTYSVTLEVKIPTEAITLIPNGEKMSGTFSVFVGVGDGKGGISNINRQRQAVNLTPTQLRALERNEFTFAMDLLMRRGENIVAVAVQDNISNLAGFQRARLDVR
ncbi:MAG: VWA domain-containing protein [Acidobacteria bacterium]|nr:VWA domain-containing protein [Acidobacteriota bacterium]